MADSLHPTILKLTPVTLLRATTMQGLVTKITSGHKEDTIGPKMVTSGHRVVTIGPKMVTSGHKVVTIGPKLVTSGHKVVLSGRRPPCDHFGCEEVTAAALKNGRPDVDVHCFGRKAVADDCIFLGPKWSQAVM